ncbi:MAG: hypothetical protein JNK15_13925 [Planctomycetes bacterium]|nr:hypothetical protein [Planctomycetota bacterium]
MAGPLLRATFEFTTAEHADVLWRHLLWSPRYRLFRLRATAILVGVVTVLAVVIDRAIAPDRTPGWRVAAVAVPALLFAAFYWLRFPRYQRQGIERRLRRTYGDLPQTCAVEVHEDHVAWQQQGKHVLVPWREFVRARIVGQDLELMGPRSALVVRGRAFATDADRTAFHTRVLELHAAHGGGRGQARGNGPSSNDSASAAVTR